MKYISTRGGVSPLSFSEAVMTGLARDGGLLLPQSIPDVGAQLGAWRQLPYAELAFEIMRLFADLADEDLRRLIGKSCASFRHAEITPVTAVGPVHVLELFHGPTLAFKDVALQFLGNLFEELLRKTGGELNVLGATSGDTGSAAICGVRGRERMRIFVMHPHNRISKVQERQMTSVLDPNVFNMAVEGTFDDCQRIMKDLFSDLAFKDRYCLGSINSINWARVLSQIVYYFYAAFRVMDRTGASEVTFAVPTGNFGDIFAGYLAARMGLPVRRLLLATNENDILSRFFNTGVYRQGNVVPTISPSMDIQVASNFERYLYYRMGEDPARLGRLMRQFALDREMTLPIESGRPVDALIAAAAGNTQETLATIGRFHREYGYLLDPHSALGVHVALKEMRSGETVICLATAHPAKFSQAILDATGADLAHHPILDALEGLPTRMDVVPGAVDAVRRYMEQRISVRDGGDEASG